MFLVLRSFLVEMMLIRVYSSIAMLLTNEPIYIVKDRPLKVFAFFYKGAAEMGKREHMEMIFLPAASGLVKIYVYGFKPQGSWGEVTAEANGVTVQIKGGNRRKAIIRSLARLNESLLNRAEE